MKFDRSDELRERARRLIPAGAHTYSKGDDQFPALSPGFIVRGQGSHVWDPDGNEFIDWGMGLRSVILGHAYEPVVKEVRKHLELGSNFTRPHPIEADVAQQLVDSIPSAQMVKFAKNGSDVTSAGIRLSRAFTGRDLVVRCQEHPFFSVDDWFIGDTACNAGIPETIRSLTLRFSYNNLESLKKVLESNSGRVACVILEPAATEEPRDQFLQKVQDVCRKHGVVLIFDEIITGLRWHPRGAEAHYGVTPDLSTWGKALGNGFAVSALVGRRDIMERGGLTHDKERVFLLSTTHGGEIHSLAAVQATLTLTRDGAVTRHIWNIGRALRQGLQAGTKEAGLEGFVRADGVECSPYISFLNRNGEVWWELRTLFLQEMIRHGVLIPYIAPSFSHTEADVDRTLSAARLSFDVLRRAVEKGSTEGLLHGPAAKPVFRRFN